MMMLFQVQAELVPIHCLCQESTQSAMNWIPIEILLVQVIRAESLLQAQKNK